MERTYSGLTASLENQIRNKWTTQKAFEKDLGMYRDDPIKLQVMEHIKPIFLKDRSVLCLIMSKVETEIEELKDSVMQSEWITY